MENIGLFLLQGTSIFSDDVRTEQKSALFMKKLLAVAVSNITYLRGIYPERAYGDRCLEGKHCICSYLYNYDKIIGGKSTSISLVYG